MPLEDFVADYQDGNAAALGDLWTGVASFIKMFVRRSFSETTLCSYDDMIQISFLAMERAAKNYDSTAGASFITYLAYYIRGIVGRFLQHNGNTDLSLDQPIGENSDDTIGAMIASDSAAAALERIDEGMYCDALHKRFLEVFSSLEADERTFMEMQLHGYNNSTIAEKMGVTYNDCIKLERRSYRKIRQAKNAARLQEFIDGFNPYTGISLRSYTDHGSIQEQYLLRKEKLR